MSRELLAFLCGNFRSTGAFCPMVVTEELGSGYVQSVIAEYKYRQLSGTPERKSSTFTVSKPACFFTMSCIE